MVGKKGTIRSIIAGAVHETPEHSGHSSPPKKNFPVDEVHVKWFSELDNNDVSIAGGKGASLSEMFNNKFPVPPGFVITAQSFDYFLMKNRVKEKIKEIIKGVDLEDTHTLNNASKEIRQLIEEQHIPDDLTMEILEAYKILSSEKISDIGVTADAIHILKNSYEPAFVSVRSSATTEDLATASFAGQQESFLNVKGERSLIDYVKKCFSSLYTPRAIYYRNRQGFSEGEALLAVVIQKMIDSEKSGVAFSKDPNSMTDTIIVEAVFGLGEGIVSGMIKPDHYVISRDLEISSIAVSEKKIAIVRTASGTNEVVKLNEAKARQQVMSNAEILDVAHYALRLEKHYQKPQDIEFALEGGKVYIVQSRPITTIGKQKEKGKAITGTVILEGLNASPGIGVGGVRIIKTMEDLVKIKKGDVMVTEMTNPDMVVAMQKSAAIITDEGGMTSHAAIVSREMGIPAVVGTMHATTKLTDGMKVTVDGFNGKVYEGEVAQAQEVEIKPAIDTTLVRLKVILDIPDFAERTSKTGLKHVGLMRLEGIIASSNRHPLHYEKMNQLHQYKQLLEEGLRKIAPYFESMWIRTSDIRTDEFSSLEGAPAREINPMLGFHGIRFSLKHPQILMAELEAIRTVARMYPSKKFGIMFPQIIAFEEVKQSKTYYERVKTANMEFGVMIETPAAVQIIDDIAEEVSFISFGTNDLTQFTLAVDRGEDSVQYLYNELHPAIFSQIKKVIEACKRKNVETSICGQAGSKKEMVSFLVREGITSISVNADAAYDISLLVKSLEEEFKKHMPEEKKIFTPLEKNEEKSIYIPHDDVEITYQRNEVPTQLSTEPLPERRPPHISKSKWRRMKKKLKWDKKGRVGFDNQKEVAPTYDSQPIKREGQQALHQSNQTPSTKRQNPSGLLDDVKIQAEIHENNNLHLEENIGPIEPFNDLRRIEKESETIETHVKERNLKRLDQAHDEEDQIKIEEDTDVVEEGFKDIHEYLEEDGV